MGDIAIRVDQLGKRYRIGVRQKGANTLRDAVSGALTDLARPFRGQTGYRAAADTIWALKDVSFEVKCGQVMGVVGRNGAGKSTLLKVLSRITEPTTGEVDMYGRVGSLLEVGTGFHPELTGRENIFLNGAVLGMRRAEVLRKFDEIVAFADIPKFVDTPVKHYSSGMYMRLAFAVAAHLEPEILLVDEVLAVGDAEFQRKCLGKMSDVAGEGRTVLFVSHQLNAVRKLCDSCLWFNAGELAAVGPAMTVVGAYETFASSGQRAHQRDKPAVAGARFQGWGISDPPGDETNVVSSDGKLQIRFKLDVSRPIRRGMLEVYLWNDDRQIMWSWVVNDLSIAIGQQDLVYSLPSLPLRPGLYSWEIGIWDGGDLLDANWLVPSLVMATAAVVHTRDEYAGVLNIACGFEVQATAREADVKPLPAPAAAGEG